MDKQEYTDRIKKVLEASLNDALDEMAEDCFDRLDELEDVCKEAFKKFSAEYFFHKINAMSQKDAVRRFQYWITPENAEKVLANGEWAKGEFSKADVKALRIIAEMSEKEYKTISDSLPRISKIVFRNGAIIEVGKKMTTWKSDYIVSYIVERNDLIRVHGKRDEGFKDEWIMDEKIGNLIDIKYFKQGEGNK